MFRVFWCSGNSKDAPHERIGFRLYQEGDCLKVECMTCQQILDKPIYKSFQILKCPHCKNVIHVRRTPLSVSCNRCGQEMKEAKDETTRSENVPVSEEVQKIVLGFYPRTEEFQFLGKGGMSEVFRFCDQGQLYCIKTLNLSEEENRQRFLREAKILAVLQNPHIVRIFHYGEQEGILFYIMEYIQGINLEEWREGKSNREILTMMAKVCRAVAVGHHHEARILHRDLKPSNILIQDNEPVLIDFGVAKILSSEHALKGYTAYTHGFTGTLDYASPEQIYEKMKDQGTWSDVFSLGVLLYELLTGRHPFPNLEYQDNTHAIPLKERIPHIHPDVDSISRKTLEIRHQDRYQDAEEMAKDMESYLQGKPVLATPLSWNKRVWRWFLRHKVTAACYLLGCIVFVITSFAVVRGWDSHINAIIQNIENEKLMPDWQKKLECLQKIWQNSNHLYYIYQREQKKGSYLESTIQYFNLAIEKEVFFAAESLLAEIQNLSSDDSFTSFADKYKQKKEEFNKLEEQESKKWYNHPKILYLIYHYSEEEK